MSNIMIVGYSGIELNHNMESIQTYHLSFMHSPRNILLNNHPNPFKHTTSIDYEVSDSSTVLMVIYDLNGVVVDTLLNSFHYPEKYNIDWDGLDYELNIVSSGNYVLKMNTNNFSDTITMTILR